MHATREEALQSAVESVERVKDAGVESMFSPMDATRTDSEFPSTSSRPSPRPTSTGSTSPTPAGGHAATLLRPHRGGRQSHRRPGRRHTHDDFGLAAANAVSGYEAGAAQAQVSVNGIGERAGNAAYEGGRDDAGEPVRRRHRHRHDADHRAGTSSRRSRASTRPPTSPSWGRTRSPTRAASTPPGSSRTRYLRAGRHDTRDGRGQAPVRPGQTHRATLRPGTARRGGLRPDRRPGPAVTRRVKDFGAEKKARHRRGTERFADDVGVEETEEEVKIWMTSVAGFDRRSATGIGGSGGETDSIPWNATGRPPTRRRAMVCHRSLIMGGNQKFVLMTAHAARRGRPAGSGAHRRLARVL